MSRLVSKFIEVIAILFVKVYLCRFCLFVGSDIKLTFRAVIFIISTA